MLAPFVIKDKINSWPATSWTPGSIADALASKSLRIRLGSKHHRPGTVQWETDSVFVQATMRQLLAWRYGTEPAQGVDPFSNLSPNDYWAYVDYKYMFDLFDDRGDEFLKAVDWGTFGCGLDGRDGLDSTFWLGTLGAYTPCHYDTYGFNLVAQLFGRKRWIMFPPHDDLAPTRLPYEESSVFSSLDFVRPNPNHLRHCHPYVVTLEPGDVLFVPRAWWHFVQSISDVTISVNTWIDTPSQDLEAKRLEALTQVLMAMNTKSAKDFDKFVISNSSLATEIDESASCSLDVERSLDTLNSVISVDQDLDQEDTMDQFLKRWRPVGVAIARVNDVDQFCESLIDNAVLTLINDKEGKASVADKAKFDESDILRAVTHPDCVRIIYQRLMKTKEMQK